MSFRIDKLTVAKSRSGKLAPYGYWISFLGLLLLSIYGVNHIPSLGQYIENKLPNDEVNAQLFEGRWTDGITILSNYAHDGAIYSEITSPNLFCRSNQHVLVLREDYFKAIFGFGGEFSDSAANGIVFVMKGRILLSKAVFDSSGCLPPLAQFHRI